MLDGFNPRERRVFARLKTPEKIQRFLDEELGYNMEEQGPTCYSPRLVLRHGIAHCMEGGLFGVAVLRAQGFPPLLLDLEAVRDDDHVLAVFKQHGHWGAIAKSNFAGLRFREPVYRTLRELVMSYFEHYFNLAGERTLRNYSRPVNLARFDHLEWMTTEEPVWFIPYYLMEIAHTPLLTPTVARRLSRVDPRLMAAGKVGRVE